MFDFYHDMAGSRTAVGSMGYVAATQDIWLKTEDGWKKIGWAQN